MIKVSRLLAMAWMGMAVAALPTTAASYVSFDGGFVITLPDDWTQIDYNVVDAYLTQNKAKGTSLQYEAVFAPKASDPFFAGDYLFLNVDTVGELSDKGIDSVLKEMQGLFGAWAKYAPSGNPATQLKSNSPVYDQSQKIVTVLNDVSQTGQPSRKNLLVMKFYQRGIASFYFYCPDSLFEQSRNVFMRIVESFSVENIEAALPREQLKVADVSQRPAETPAPAEQPKRGSSVIWLGVAVVLMLVVVRLMKRRRENAGK